MVPKRSLALKIKQTTRLDSIKEAKWKSLSHGFVLYHRKWSGILTFSSGFWLKSKLEWIFAIVERAFQQIELKLVHMIHARTQHFGINGGHVLY